MPASPFELRAGGAHLVVHREECVAGMCARLQPGSADVGHTHLARRR